ncbi:hypothetical protein [Mesorhizobium sp. M1378]|uniref:amino acid kinase family protein n=1 Tax=Mesorhizobium sp. M1378 TaxID=2957092 RepID=UPI003338903A
MRTSAGAWRCRCCGCPGDRSVRQVTFLGRNSSDLTAIVIASMLGERSCEIYSDVPGVYRADCPGGTTDFRDCLWDGSSDVAIWRKGTAPQGG